MLSAEAYSEPGQTSEGQGEFFTDMFEDFNQWLFLEKRLVLNV